MPSPSDLIREYDTLGAPDFSAPHDFVLRQRRLEDWAQRAHQFLLLLEGPGHGLGVEAQAAIAGLPETET